MSDVECKHGLTEATCSFCRPRASRPPDAPERTVVAAYESRCIGCGRTISEGQRIGLFDREWLCEVCW